MKLFVVYLHCWVLYLTPKNYLHYNSLKPFKQTLHPYHNFVFPNCDVEQIVEDPCTGIHLGPAAQGSNTMQILVSCLVSLTTR